MGIRDEEPYAVESEVNSFVRDMQQEQFDLVINFQGEGKSVNPLIKRFNARYTLGCAGDDVLPLDRMLPYYYYQSEVLRFQELVQLVGAQPHTLEPVLKVLAEDQREVEAILDIIGSQQFAVLHPGAEDLRRMWPANCFAELADELANKNIKIVLTGHAKDALLIEGISAAMKHNAINTCGQLELGGLCALLAKAALVVCADTGPLHLARAVGAATVGIYWAPNLINWGPLYRGNHHPVVSWDMHCPLCGAMPNQPMPFLPQQQCTHNVSFVQNVTVGEVLAGARRLLQSIKRTETQLTESE